MFPFVFFSAPKLQCCSCITILAGDINRFYRLSATHIAEYTWSKTQKMKPSEKIIFPKKTKTKVIISVKIEAQHMKFPRNCQSFSPFGRIFGLIN